jgi:triosephosphate isomerase
MKKIIVANWKCNPPTLSKAKELFDAVKEGIRDCKSAEVIICPPFVFLPILKLYDSSLSIGLGGQDCFWKTEGAFTGEISPLMLKDSGCDYVILGHSERRRVFKEKDEMVADKIKAALDSGLKPILCVEDASSLKNSLKGISKEDYKKIIVAFEPIFAIGTGKPCGWEKAEKTRKDIVKVLGEESAVLYGGSVNSQNAKDYVGKAGFLGLLVGGASLNPKEFLAIVNGIK